MAAGFTSFLGLPIEDVSYVNNYFWDGWHNRRPVTSSDSTVTIVQSAGQISIDNVRPNLMYIGLGLTEAALSGGETRTVSIVPVGFLFPPLGHPSPGCSLNKPTFPEK